MPTKSDIHKESDWLRKCSLIFLFHGERSMGTKRPNKWKLLDTANELDYSVGFVSESIFLAKNIPLVDKCKTRDEALSLLRRL